MIYWYSPFHKTLPKFSLLMHWISVRLYEIGDSLKKLLFNISVTFENRKKFNQSVIWRLDYFNFNFFYIFILRKCVFLCIVFLPKPVNSVSFLEKQAVLLDQWKTRFGVLIKNYTFNFIYIMHIIVSCLKMVTFWQFKDGALFLIWINYIFILNG